MANRKILLKQNVLEAARERVRWVFDEFPEVIVSVSGGKDSTVVLELALEAAREKGRLPLKVLFLDQEGEWQGTIDTIREILSRPEVDPVWIQTSFRINNAVSFTSDYVQVWGKDEDWIRPKEEISRKNEGYDDLEWTEMFQRIMKKEVGDRRACFLAGVRAEESPRRSAGLTANATYKHVTWGKILDRSKHQYTFYPIYDWSYTDVWHAIETHGWKYNAVYDQMYRYGVSLNDMRISCLFHETSLRSLFVLQEIEPETYQAFTRRIQGTDTAGKMSHDDFYGPKEVPFMFSGWKEYRDYLLENLIANETHRREFAEKFVEMEERLHWIFGDALHRRQISSILSNDFLHTKLNNIVVPRHLWEEYKRRRDLKKEGSHDPATA